MELFANRPISNKTENLGRSCTSARLILNHELHLGGCYTSEVIAIKHRGVTEDRSEPIPVFVRGLGNLNCLNACHPFERKPIPSPVWGTDYSGVYNIDFCFLGHGKRYFSNSREMLVKTVIQFCISLCRYSGQQSSRSLGVE